MDTAPVIETRNVTKVFYTDDIETHALGGINLTVQAGEYVSIVGPSGCGKTTLLGILGLMDRPTAGDFYFGGQPVDRLDDRELSARRNQQVGFVFQAFNLIGDLTVEQNVELPLVYGRIRRKERRRRVEQALSRVGILHRSRHRPGQLSGGQQQRVAVARALVRAPEILLADEPTGNLDSVSARGIMDLLEELHDGGATVCMVTHNPEFARRAERIVRLSDGRIVEDVD